jgi:hypothetical protein
MRVVVLKTKNLTLNLIRSTISPAAFMRYTRCYRLVFGRVGLAHMWAGLRELLRWVRQLRGKNLPITIGYTQLNRFKTATSRKYGLKQRLSQTNLLPDEI